MQDKGQSLLKKLAPSLDLFMAIGIQDSQTASQITDACQSMKTALFFDCLPSLQQLTRLDGLQADRYSPC